MSEPHDVDAWITEGDNASPVADQRSMILVAGEDSRAAALAALGLARAQNRHARRVAVIDLTGGAAPLQDLISDDDPHGIVDTLLHGVSLARVSRQVDEEGLLFVVPTGTQDADEEIIRHDRWRRLRATFRESHSLAVVLVSPEIPALESLANVAEGVVLVGPSARLRTLPNIVETLPGERAAGVPPSYTGSMPAAARGPELTENMPAASTADVESTQVSAAATAAASTTGAAAAATKADAVAEMSGSAGRSSDAGEERSRAPRMNPMGRESGPNPLVWAALVLVAIAAIAWYFMRGGNAAERTTDTSVAAGTTSREAPGVVDTTESTVVDFRNSARVVNPADSAGATPFSVELVSSTTGESAWRFLVASPAVLPAASVSPVTIEPDTTRWFRVVAGAYSASSRADSLLRAARAAGVMGADAGRVIRSPIALRVASDLTPASASQRARQLRQREIGAYVLQQPDGTAHIYVGAFETPQQAQYLAGQLRSNGVETVIAYRTGRLD
ncbi:MAG TPA: hypothetical protein VKZ41_10720 [Gemmatimonadales bacterium]|nr:hypothetical protein [Gemmatimonadales bacterium]